MASSSSSLEPFSSSPSSSLSLPPVKDEGYRNWAELPPELTSSILHRLGVIEILENAQKVCMSWRHVCKDPSMWRRIDMHNPSMWERLILDDSENKDYDLEIMCRHAVDRSQGGLREIDLWYFATDDLLNYIADRSSNLRRLKLVECDPITDDGFVEAVVKLPLLEELEISHCKLSGESLKVIGQSCPNLKTLKLNSNHIWLYDGNEITNEKCIAIGENMPQLRYLELIGNTVINSGLDAIRDGCPHLEYLDLRATYNVELEKRCVQSVLDSKRSRDPTTYHQYRLTSPEIDRDEDEDAFDLFR